MVPIFRPCSRANSTRSGRRAMVPSSFMISQMTEAGVRPASAARSQPASVWPARISTPPGCAISGKMWPGWTRSSAWALRATATCTVRARSAAEMPVVTPSAASMETVKLVPCGVPLRVTINGRSSWRQRSAVSVRQIRPRPNRAMKLIASGVTKSAARIRSPSFSRSSSSTRMTIRPARISAMISSTVAIDMAGNWQRAAGQPWAAARLQKWEPVIVRQGDPGAGMSNCQTAASGRAPAGRPVAAWVSIRST